MVHPDRFGATDARPFRQMSATTKPSACRGGRWCVVRGVNAAMIAIARQRIPDLNSGLRCFRREVIERYLHLLPDGFSASTTSTLLMIKRGYRLDYVPIVTERRVGTSTVKISDGLATLHLMTRLMVLFDAFRFFTALSALQILPGLIYGLILAIDKGMGFPTFAAMLVISGVLTFLIGLVCDQIAAMRQERFEHG